MILTIVYQLSAINSFGQGTIRGKVTDANGEALIGVIIVLKSNRSIGTISDLDGNYSLKITKDTNQAILISYLGYYPIEEFVHPVKGKNITLIQVSNQIDEVEISAKAVRANDNYMEKIKTKSATTIDYVSSETMKKTGDANVTSAVARVTGVSTNGAFITVRGIGDRYIKTTINGSRIPTLDPFTNNIKLDLFPASLVDNIIITKTASPELPGDWAGAYLSIETKDYPDKLSVNFETSVGYNNQTTFKNIVTSQHSSTDWLGYDNGFRDHSHNDFNYANLTPNQYQEFVALGLGEYYKSLGVTNITPWNETYYKLGLVELGLLDKALFNDADAFKKAKDNYNNGPYKEEAFNVINAGAVKTGQSFPNNWNTSVRQAPLSFSQSIGIGNQTTLFGKPLGFIAGFRYGSSISYDPNSIANRVRYDRSFESSSDQQISKENNGWSALLNLAYKFNSNNSISLMFMPNLTGTNNVLNSVNHADSTQFVLTKSQFYEERRQLIYQLKSEHYLPGPELKIDINASYTNGSSSAPDFKNLQYWNDAKSNSYQIGGTIGDGIHRYYRYLTDDLLDTRLNLEMPIFNKPGMVRKIKFGAAYQNNQKINDQYDYNLLFGSLAYPLLNDDLDKYFSLDKFGIHNYLDNSGNHNTIDYYYSLYNSPANHTFGRSNIIAGYLMLDYTIIPSLRISGGLRVEHADILTDVDKFDSLGYIYNDPRRKYREGFPIVNPGKSDEINYLPSANIIFNLNKDESVPINLRLNYSITVARPSIRELSDISLFDYELRSYVFGNSSLKTIHIQNYDLRLESYFKSGDNLSMSLFYKDFKNHIELVNTMGYTWQNVDKSQAMGIELEGKKVITKHLDIKANISLINSQTSFVRSRIQLNQGIKEYIPVDKVKRPMYGQAPYVINTIVTYKTDNPGLLLTLSYNVQGSRLTIASDVKEIPDIYELPRHMLDFKAIKSLGKNISIGLTVRDILNSSIRRAYKYSDKWVDYDKYTYGTNYIFSISYKF